jgi:hypothetical protein
MGINMLDNDWLTIINKYKKTCNVCNRSMVTGELILWNKKTKESMHQPEMCNFLGIRKKMPKRRVEEPQYVFPVEVRKIG